MPTGQPFTALCQAVHRLRTNGRADLHIHTTYSDGSYTPAEVVSLARRSGLAAVAVTDHDTLEGIGPAQAAAVRTGVEIIPGVEITAEYEGREVHLLGYFVRPDDAPLTAALARLSRHRVERFREMVVRLRSKGVSLDDEALRLPEAEFGTLGRRNLAELLVKARQAGSVREAFQRWLGDNGCAVVPKLRLPLEEAIALVRKAGGVASWAHPSYDCTRENLSRFRALGLQAVEAYYPSFKANRTRQLRTWAAELGLALTGGSDCHGPERAIGSCSLPADDFLHLRGFMTRWQGDKVSG
jgi:hypothetical protein